MPTRAPDTSPPHWVMFQRDDCSLCDQALALLAAGHAPEFASVFIDGDPALEARYGARVPVLRDEHNGVELDWPFAQDALRALFATRSSSRRFGV